jgi:hydroxymethylglutaryl-CoA reductase
MSCWRRRQTSTSQRGHMSLHASNIAVAAGAAPEELSEVVARLIKAKAVRQDHAEQILAELRARQATQSGRARIHDQSAVTAHPIAG